MTYGAENLTKTTKLSNGRSRNLWIYLYQLVTHQLKSLKPKVKPKPNKKRPLASLKKKALWECASKFVIQLIRRSLKNASSKPKQKRKSKNSEEKKVNSKTLSMKKTRPNQKDRTATDKKKSLWHSTAPTTTCWPWPCRLKSYNLWLRITIFNKPIWNECNMKKAMVVLK